MKHTPRIPNAELTLGLKQWIRDRRKIKNFNAADYVGAKTKLLKAYFAEHGIQTAVVAISGGVDSAIVFGLLSKIPNLEVIAVTLPARGEIGATRQDKTVELANSLSDVFKIPVYEFNLHDPVSEIQNGIKSSLLLTSSPWARGQAVAYVRTASLYSLVASLNDKKRTVLVGTTNRDEGSYLGYIGKASDGMVDIQPISDLHKSEVYAVALHLNVPPAIINAIPTGDMYDGRTDEEVFGAPYDFVELYTSLKHQYRGTPDSWNKNLTALALRDSSTLILSNEDHIQFNLFGAAIEELHAFNRHKYIGSSPAVHLDLTPFDLPDGWKTNCVEEHLIPNTLEAPKELSSQGARSSWNWLFCQPMLHRSMQPTFDMSYMENGAIIHFKNVFDSGMIKSLEHYSTIAFDFNADSTIQCRRWRRADVHGRTVNYDSTGIYWRDDIDVDADNSLHGSERKSLFMNTVAAALYAALAPSLPAIYDSWGKTDLTADGLLWSRSRINPFFRFIRYGVGDWLVPHYDDAYRASPSERSLQSVVIYLTGGVTRFLRENRKVHNYTDCNTAPDLEDVIYEVACEPGDVLVFDHRLFHDCAPVKENKLIIRTDLMYQRPQLGRALKKQ